MPRCSRQPSMGDNMADITETIQKMIQPNLRKRLYVAFSYPVASQEEMLARVPEHLTYMEQHEDKIFLSGPFIKEGALVDQGMTILHSHNEEEAAEFMRNEPLIKHGLRRFELRLWEIREGIFRAYQRRKEPRLINLSQLPHPLFILLQDN
jgi:uncharacterized protein YciI